MSAIPVNGNAPARTVPVPLTIGLTPPALAGMQVASVHASTVSDGSSASSLPGGVVVVVVVGTAVVVVVVGGTSVVVDVVVAVVVGTSVVVVVVGGATSVVVVDVAGGGALVVVVGVEDAPDEALDVELSASAAGANAAVRASVTRMGRNRFTVFPLP